MREIECTPVQSNHTYRYPKETSLFIFDISRTIAYTLLRDTNNTKHPHDNPKASSFLNETNGDIMNYSKYSNIWFEISRNGSNKRSVTPKYGKEH